MKQTIVWTLIAANVALAGTLGWRGLKENTANAQQQMGPAARPPLDQGKYVLIPGDSQVGVSIVYVFDAANKRLGAIAPDAKDIMTSMPTIMLEPVFNALATGGVRPAADEPGGNVNGNNTGRGRQPGQPRNNAR